MLGLGGGLVCACELFGGLLPFFVVYCCVLLGDLRGVLCGFIRVAYCYDWFSCRCACVVLNPIVSYDVIITLLCLRLVIACGGLNASGVVVCFSVLVVLAGGLWGF